MKKIILHVPHSSTKIPNYKGYLMQPEALEEEMLLLTDWYTDDLFSSEDGNMIRADFSRIFCDPERFTDDTQEVMAKFGMGVLYEKTDKGMAMREVSPQFKEEVLEQYYWEHHGKFNEAVAAQLKDYDKALILDCHSYPSIPIARDLNQNSDRPDFNIGIDAFHTPQSLIELSKDFFESKGFSLGVDWPYSGSIVPLEYYQKENRVESIMLEINRKLYLEEPTNKKSGQYELIKEVTGEYIKELYRSL